MLDLIDEAIETYVSVLEDQQLKVPKDRFKKIRYRAERHEQDLTHAIRMHLVAHVDDADNQNLSSQTIKVLGDICHLESLYPSHASTYNKVFQKNLIKPVLMLQFEKIIGDMITRAVQSTSSVHQTCKCKTDLHNTIIRLGGAVNL